MLDRILLRDKIGESGRWEISKIKKNFFFLIASTIEKIILSGDPEVVAVREKIFTNRRE